MCTLNCRGKLVSLQKPAVMGILNVTEDSFYTGSRHKINDALLHAAEAMLHSGAAILDVGGQSTRPGSKRLTAPEEAAAVVPAIAAICRAFPQAIISVDTFYASVAEEAVAAGAAIVNDISAGVIDAAMFATVAALQVPYVLMHMQGNPQTMQQQPEYKDVVTEVLDFLVKKIALLQQAGVNDIIVDPGFGFGKTTGHNFALLKNLHAFSVLRRPILLGVSRKGSIYRTLGVTAEAALNGTTVLNTMGILNGASLLRVHDVKEAVEVIKLCEYY
ncbi:MAG: dihydropteroate synthase [Niabella sp.]|nr:dihydropteroate synthase [Niabella sp.]